MPNAERLFGFLALAPHLSPERVQRAFERQFPRDALGHRIHVALGMLWCFALATPTSAIEIASVPLILYSLLRLTNTHKTIDSWALQPLVILLALLAAWQAVSLAWTPNRKQGLDDLAVLRWAWATWALWPVMDRRLWFIIAMAMGFAVGMCVQLLHATGVDFGLAALRFNRPPGRLSGWWDPAVGGSLLVASLGLHMAPAILASGRARLVAIAASVVTLVAILATGTRGAWIAAALTLATLLVIAAWRVRPSRRLIPMVVFGLAAASLVAIGGWSIAGQSVKDRAIEARREIDGALQGDFSSFTGGRVLMAREAAALAAEHPIRGVGIGGFEHAARARLEAAEPGSTEAKYKDRIHAHAHNTLLHIAATTGVVGVAIAMALAITAFHGAADRRWLPLDASPITYQIAPLGAIIALAWVSLFDTLQVNSQTAAMLATIFGLCLLNPPKEPEAQARG